MKLSILICTTSSRRNFLVRSIMMLRNQMTSEDWCDIEILINDSDTDTIGAKRNDLLQRSRGQYVCFFDDDDVPEPNYIAEQIKVADSGCDCGSFTGLYYENNQYRKPFVHSIKYTEYSEDDGYYYRPPNHLNAIKSSIAKQFSFPENNFGEDTEWAMQISNSGLLKSEYATHGAIYNYYYRSNK